MTYETILPLDKFANNETNHVRGEEHAVNSDAETVFVLNRGAFYTKDLVVVNLTTGLPLQIGVDYNPVHHYAELTNKFGLEVMCAISIKNPAVRGLLSVDYRAVGAGYQNLTDPLRAIIATLLADGRPVEYGQIIGLPDQFNPAAHLHPIYDTYGYEYMVEAAYAIEQALVNGSQAAVQEVLTVFYNVTAEMRDTINYLTAALNEHIGATGNVHLLTRQQLSVDKLPNTGWATNEQALQYLPGYLASPATIKLVADVLINSAMQAHLAAPNPHGITKNTVNLGLVENLGIATLAQYNAGTNGYVNTLLLKEVLNANNGSYVLKSEYNAHVADVNNRFATLYDNPADVRNKIGLNLINNYATATPAQTAQGIANNLHVTPAGVAAAISALSPVKSVQGRTGPVTLIPADRPSLGLGENDSPQFISTISAGGGKSARFSPDSIDSNDGVNGNVKFPFPVNDPGYQMGSLLTSAYAHMPYSFATYTTVPMTGGALQYALRWTQSDRSVEVVDCGDYSLPVTFSGTASTNQVQRMVDTTKKTSANGGNATMEITNNTLHQAVKLMYFLPTTRPILWSGILMPEEGPPDLNNGLVNVVAIHYNSAMPAGKQYLLSNLGAFQS